MTLHHKHLESFIFLLGLHYIYKNTGYNSLKSLVNAYKIDPENLRYLIESLSYDDTFDQLIDDELYQTLLDVQISQDILQDLPIQGSIEFFLGLTKNLKELLDDLDKSSE